MEHTQTPDSAVKNSKSRDNGAKLIFSDPILCAEFLRGYVDIDLLKEVQPEDIEDISERFLPMWQEGRDSDSVKKIHLKDQSLFLIAIIEHQSKIDYDMSFRLLRYIVMVLTDYANEQEKLHPGITKTKEFKYPPILPVVYYEGTDSWSASLNLKDRVYLSDILGTYIPSFEYLVVPLTNYSNLDLIEKKYELSLLFLINKLRSSSDFKELQNLPPEYFESLSRNTPEYLLELISKILAVFLYRLNIPRKEVEHFTDQIKRRDFDMLFDSFEAYDVQETRRVSRAQGRLEGADLSLIRQVCKKIQKQIPIAEIAEMLEEDISVIQPIYNIAVRHAFLPNSIRNQANLNNLTGGVQLYPSYTPPVFLCSFYKHFCLIFFDFFKPAFCRNIASSAVLLPDISDWKCLALFHYHHFL